MGSEFFSQVSSRKLLSLAGRIGACKRLPLHRREAMLLEFPATPPFNGPRRNGRNIDLIKTSWTHCRGRPGSRSLSLLSHKESKQRNATADLPFGFPFVAVQKWEMSATRFPCRAHIRLQANTVTQAQGMPCETPASPQTSDISDPFLHRDKRLRLKRKFKVNCKTKTQLCLRYPTVSNFDVTENQNHLPIDIGMVIPSLPLTPQLRNLLLQ